MRRRPPRSTRTDTLFPYTTLFRSGIDSGVGEQPREECGVGTVHFGGALAEQALGTRADALRLAAQRDEVEVGFEHLFVRPVQRERLSGAPLRSVERRVGTECLRTCSYRWSQAH